MSVQCKNCAKSIKIGTKTKCLAWVNMGYVNIKKQRLCRLYIKKLILPS